MKLKGHKYSLRIAIACLLIALWLILMGCATVHKPVVGITTVTVGSITVHCTDGETVKQKWAEYGGDPTITNAVYAFALRTNHIYIPCVEINGLILPEDMCAFGHEMWHPFSFENLICRDPDRRKE